MTKVCIAKILTAHGVRGLVKIDCYLEDPQELMNYNPLSDSAGREYTITLKNPIKGKWLAEIKGVADRTVAEKYRNIELFTARDQLPDADDGYYHEDLIDLEVRKTDGTKIGTIIGIDNFGASDVIEVKPETGKTFYLPFTEPYLVDVNMEEKFITVEGAEGFIE
jgi:16S rRNA processing protein RimM